MLTWRKTFFSCRQALTQDAQQSASNAKRLTACISICQPCHVIFHFHQVFPRVSASS